MKYSSAIVLSALAALTNAQTAPDFPVQVDATLRVEFANNVLEAPTVYAPRDVPELSTYVVFMVDEDVDTGDGGQRVQLLHWFQPNMVGEGAAALELEANAQNATTAAGAFYIAPTPPGGDGPHRYTLLLYPQPSNFSVPDAYASFSPPAEVTDRYPFNMSGFAEAAGLGQPLSANWFQVENATVPDNTTSTSSSGSASATATTSGSESSGTAAATTTTATGSGASPSSSAATTSSAGNAAGLVEVRGSARELVMGLILGVAGAWLWMI